MKKSHVLAKRRDRRKAKASGWRREGKPTGKIKGHGVRGSSQTTHRVTSPHARKEASKPVIRREEE